MKLSDATLLLGEQSRYFSEAYKQFSFKDDQELKDYLDFIMHEPVEWLKGLPGKLKTKNTLSRPKTALVKLLKLPSVKQDLTEVYVDQVYSTIWQAFKKNIDKILETRNKTHSANIVEQLAEPLQEEDVVAEELSTDNVEGACRKCVEWEQKYNVCNTAMHAMLQDYAYTVPGLANAFHILLQSVNQS
jgi:hypothetical protein